ncbi:MAG TPA: HAD family hydrolase [Pyrinomonadaceae bacterium]|nr:HAD family hydrolase [Pyrinomonadaceae bacterium]
MLHPSLEGARACVFDAGGTLVHPDWPRLGALAADEAGRELAPAELERALKEVLRAVAEEMQREGWAIPEDQKLPHWTFRRMYCSLGLSDEACGRVIERLGASHIERHLWCGTDPEAAGVIAELKRRGLLVGVISNTEDGRAADSLEAAGLLEEFDVVIDSRLVGVRKPDPAIFRLALERLGVGPAEAAFVGDSYAHDALAARAAGMRAVLLDPLGLHPESVCPRIKRLGELINQESEVRIRETE